MSEQDGSTDSVEPEWVRRRRLAAVFGDVLPEQSGDDRDEPGPGSGSASGPRQGGTGKGDDWYRAEVPPHHG